MTTPHDTASGQPTTPADGRDTRQALAEVMKTLARVTLLGGLSDEQKALLQYAQTKLEALAQKTLPAASAVTQVRTVLEPTNEEPALPTVLVVEDDADSRDLIQSLLERHYKVYVAQDTREGSKLIQEVQPDVIITDLYMPGGGGMTLLESVRADEETAQTPVLVFSGAADLQSKIKAFEGGAFDFMTKPLVADELMARVRNAVRRAQALHRERKLKGTDDLTGLGNRRTLRSFLTSALRSAVQLGRPLTVAMIDQDDLKKINDLYGHHAGDDAIRAVSKALLACKRGSDCAVRLGGDEFSVVMPGTDRDGALAFIGRVEEHLAQHPIRVGDSDLRVRASFGVATVGEVAWEESWEELLKRADAQLYDAKRARKASALKLVG